MKKIHISVLTLSCLVLILIIGCSRAVREDPDASIIGAQEYKDYVPTEPSPSPLVTYFDTSGRKVTNAWSELNNEQVRRLLPNIHTEISVAKVDASGTLKYLAAKSTQEAGAYKVVMDYTQYLVHTEVDSNTGKEKWRARIGVGLRMTANIQTFESNIELSNLLALGFAAKLRKLSGSLSVDIIGIGSADIGNLLVSNSTIDETSIQKTLESMAAIKAKIPDAGTTLTPQIVWARPIVPDVTPSDIRIELSGISVHAQQGSITLHATHNFTVRVSRNQTVPLCDHELLSISLQTIKLEKEDPSRFIVNATIRAPGQESKNFIFETDTCISYAGYAIRAISVSNDSVNFSVSDEKPCE